MIRYTHHNLKDIPVEHAHGGSGSRQVLVTPDMFASPHFEAMTKGFLETGKSYDWHTHEGIDEVFVVIQGTGKFYWEHEVVEYTEGDVITIPANSMHKIEALGSTLSEFFFVRVKCR